MDQSKLYDSQHDVFYQPASFEEHCRSLITILHARCLLRYGPFTVNLLSLFRLIFLRLTGLE
jgi:hypothetical protein